MNDKLLNCPFCGGEAKTYPSIHTKDGVRMEVWYAMCKGCKINYPQAYDTYATTEEEAIKYWNTRKPMERIVEQLEAELELAEKQKEECTFKGLPYYDRTEGYIVATSNAIEIVKGGVDNAG